MTLPEHFCRHGYHTASLGKIFHDVDEGPHAWSAPAWHPGCLPDASLTWRNYLRPENNALETLYDDPGAPGVLTWSWDAGRYEQPGGTGRVTRWFDRDGVPQEETRTVDEADTPAIHHRPLHAFARRLRGEDAPLVTGGTAAFLLRVLHAVYDGAEGGRAVTVGRAHHAA